MTHFFAFDRAHIYDNGYRLDVRCEDANGNWQTDCPDSELPVIGTRVRGKYIKSVERLPDRAWIRVYLQNEAIPQTPPIVISPETPTIEPIIREPPTNIIVIGTPNYAGAHVKDGNPNKFHVRNEDRYGNPVEMDPLQYPKPGDFIAPLNKYVVSVRSLPDRNWFEMITKDPEGLQSVGWNIDGMHFKYVMKDEVSGKWGSLYHVRYENLSTGGAVIPADYSSLPKSGDNINGSPVIYSEKGDAGEGWASILLETSYAQNPDNQTNFLKDFASNTAKLPLILGIGGIAMIGVVLLVKL